MAYTAPYIDSAGLHLASYEDILAYLESEMKSIYGDDIYLGTDSQDYQMISIFASMLNDISQVLQIVYNNRSPKTAVGTGLDSIVKLNGIVRKSASYSTCVLTLTGTSGTVISSGTCTDTNGYKWELPTDTTLTGTTTEVTATCETIGAIEAAIGTITTISTPQKGWTAVTNDVAAVTGTAVETDTEIRARQSTSVALPSQNMTDGVIAGIQEISNVDRYKVYENDTNAADTNGIPGHSIAAVVEGGTDASVAEQVFLRKGPGCGTYGSSSATYTQTDGTQNTVYFSRPTYESIDITVTITKGTGYTSAVGDNIISYLKSYMAALDIGDNVSITGLMATALQAITDTSKPSFSLTSIQIAKTGGTLGTSDIAIEYNQIAQSGAVTLTAN
ncbi:hypothetical protein AB840_11195 [Megasphaera cerevisiae DSM 20462]|uniref:Baseplate protein J-like barrel domain-containing protein n=1 Tax=Megasphaera cerevisiae DSM 20462 TaxID=1122219 RepID=A0A0J6WUH7_9FIRM|nr:baseplate J/gp47 family protein [Megasphaera cerevisiae]KMO85838.1 hypothetical protein AB840_11195 [Megasphaera cerevisiae DSM 20462]SJZ58429.1 Uncharacterized phage protein gp47/JayE [Megasphaera cerevisiae DSM 20462]